MKAPLLYLALASLLLALALGDHQWFVHHHTHSTLRRSFDCDTHVNDRQKHLTYCRPSSSVILGDNIDRTSLADVVEVCSDRRKNVPVGRDHRSIREFRVVTCRLDRTHPNTNPPNCKYIPTYQRGQITVSCSGNQPVHFVSVTPRN